MEGETVVAVEPAAHLDVLVGSVVVEDDMHGLVGGNLGVDGIEESAIVRCAGMVIVHATAVRPGG